MDKNATILKLRLLASRNCNNDIKEVAAVLEEVIDHFVDTEEIEEATKNRLDSELLELGVASLSSDMVIAKGMGKLETKIALLDERENKDIEVLERDLTAAELSLSALRDDFGEYIAMASRKMKAIAATVGAGT
jgi:hypothetical protein